MTTESDSNKESLSNLQLENALRDLKFKRGQLSFEDDGCSALALPFNALYATDLDTSTAAQISFGGFHSLNPRPEVAMMWQGFGKPWTSVMSYGCLILRSSYAILFNNVLNPDQGDELALLDFLDSTLADDWKVPAPFAVEFGEEGAQINWNESKTAMVVNFIVTVPVSEQDWQRTMKLRTLELEAAGKLQQYMIEKQLAAEQRLAPGSSSIN